MVPWNENLSRTAEATANRTFKSPWRRARNAWQCISNQKLDEMRRQVRFLDVFGEQAVMVVTKGSRVLPWPGVDEPPLYLECAPNQWLRCQCQPAAGCAVSTPPVAECPSPWAHQPQPPAALQSEISTTHSKHTRRVLPAPTQRHQKRRDASSKKLCFPFSFSLGRQQFLQRVSPAGGTRCWCILTAMSTQQ